VSGPNGPIQLSFNASLNVDFHGSRVTSDGDLIPVRQLDERLGLLVNTGGRLIKHARYYWLVLAESHLTRRLCASLVRRIGALAVAAGEATAGKQTGRRKGVDG
jgi:hypothetical protein